MCLKPIRRDLFKRLAHQCNHVFVLITHPVARHCFLAHNRHDMRCVPHTTQLIENASCMTGCILDQFIANDAYIDCNADNLVTEVRALIEDQAYRQKMLSEYACIRKALGGRGASAAVAKAMIRELGATS